MKTIPASAVLAVISLLAACGHGGGQGTGGAGAVPEVGVITLQPQPVQLSTELPGRTAAYRIAEVRPQVEGIIKRRLFTEGSEVQAGQQLYEIDPAPFQAALLRAQAALASSQAQLNAAKLLADRYEPLQAKGVVSKQDYDNAAAASRSAEAAVEGAQAAVEAAKIDLGHTEVRAPIAGRIGRSLVTEGALVKDAQDQALATIAQLDPIYVDVTESSAELLRQRHDFDAGLLQHDAKQQAKVTLKLEDGSSYPQAGSLQFSEVTVDEGTGSVLLRAVFPNPRRVLLPGMFVRATLGVGSSRQALLVPQGAVSRNARGDATVLVVDAAGKVGERVIQVDRAVGSSWLVSSGLASGERIIVEGLQKARPGTTVNALPAGQAGAAGAGK
ncbi:MAG TPA: efflux RND transporter periplasmic adaptor subunit [Steroidobacteraceae bacterium]|nr:efflux RND transporter periplasmic adaptor subunit [Steroidobacteraceae bacterium]